MSNALKELLIGFLLSITLRQEAEQHYRHKSLFVWAKSFLPTYILNLLGDRMEMAHSIEGRVPFLDRQVVECLCRVPVSLEIRGLTEKYLLGEAAKPVITNTVYRRQKHSFLSPPVATVPTERFHQMLQDTLCGDALVSMPFYNQKKVVALLDDLPAMSNADRVGWDPVLISILSACVSQQRFKLNQLLPIHQEGGSGYSPYHFAKWDRF